MRLRRLARRRLRRLVLVAAGIAVLMPATALATDDDDDLPRADLAVSVTGMPRLVQGGETVTFTVTVVNQGPGSARRVRMAVALTGRIGIEDAAGPGWSCEVAGAMADCTRRYLRRNAAATLTVTAIAPPGFARVGAGAFVTARNDDPNRRNNSATDEVAINNPPVLVADHATTTDSAAVDIDVLDNDFDPDGDGLEITAVTQPGKGTAECKDLLCTYTPAAGETGDQIFTYTVSDDRGASATATVTVTVTPTPPSPPNPPPPEPSGPPAPPPGTVPPPIPLPDNSGNAATGVTVRGPTAAATDGTVVSYVAIVANGCKVAARKVVVHITIPAGATLVSAPARAVRRGRIVTVRLGTLRMGSPRGVGIKLRFGPNGGDLRSLVVAVTSANSRLTGDGIVITVR